ncbi:hypothetical protein [Nostoc sp.]
MTNPNRGVLFVQALGQKKRLLSEKHPLVTTSLNNIAGLCYNQVEELLVEALRQRKWLLGEKHPSIATSLNSIAGLCYNQVEELLVEALRQRKWLLGENILLSPLASTI